MTSSACPCFAIPQSPARIPILKCSSFTSSRQANGKTHRDPQHAQQTRICMVIRASRRQLLHYVTATSSLYLAALLTTPDETQAVPNLSLSKPEDLKLRVAQRAPPRPKARLLTPDIFYPDYFVGTWDTESKMISVTCPAGYKLFGRPGSFESAQKEIQNIVKYPTRFIRVGDHVVSDRSFNVKAIAEASMGEKTVLDCRQPGNSPNLLTTTLRPNGAMGGVFVVNLKAISRDSQVSSLPKTVVESLDFSKYTPILSQAEEQQGFYTSEMVRQEIRQDTSDLRTVSKVKEIETTTIFITRPDDRNHILAWQKTSTYLPKSDLQYVDAKGRPVDVRWYELSYNRREQQKI